MLKAVVDTNLWISFLIGRKLSILKELLARSDIKLLTSSEQLAELYEVANRLKFRRYFTGLQAEELLGILSATSEIVEVNEHIHACRDEDDDFLLEVAVNGHADILITGDADLRTG